VLVPGAVKNCELNGLLLDGATGGLFGCCATAAWSRNSVTQPVEQSLRITGILGRWFGDEPSHRSVVLPQFEESAKARGF
jgi:hypothetical protein